MHWTAILDSEVEVVAIPLKFWVRTLTWEVFQFPFQRSYWELGISNFWVQKERGIKTGISNPTPGALLSVQL